MVARGLKLLRPQHMHGFPLKHKLFIMHTTHRKITTTSYALVQHIADTLECGTWRAHSGKMHGSLCHRLVGGAAQTAAAPKTPLLIAWVSRFHCLIDSKADCIGCTAPCQRWCQAPAEAIWSQQAGARLHHQCAAMRVRKLGIEAYVAHRHSTCSRLCHTRGDRLVALLKQLLLQRHPHSQLG